ncbi:MAG: fatty acyl-AMP ligase [Marinilabiliaceae bacterium]|nr:fatty acyl-AMP ligase [Marinilabiliaceae bacterium]
MNDLEFETYKQVIEEQCNVYGEKDLYVFLADGEETIEKITYQDFLIKVKNVAGNIQKYLTKGDRVLILYPPGIDFNVAFISCVYANVLPVPLYPPDTRSLDRVLNVIKDCNPKAAFANKQTIEKFSGAGSQTFIQKNLKENPFIAETISKLSFFNVDEFNYENSYQDVICKPHDVMYLQYTSGSTSAPKGVMVTHDNLINNSRYIAEFFGQDDKEIVVSWIPPFHDMGLIKDVLTTIYTGSTLIFMAPNSFIRKPVRWLKAISDYKHLGNINSGGPNFAYDLCVKAITDDQMDGLDLSHWKLAYNGSEPIYRKTLDEFYNKFKSVGLNRMILEPVYGLAEATLMVSGPTIEDNNPVIRMLDKNEMKINRAVYHNLESDQTIPVVCCGKIIPEQITLIVNPDTFEVCKNKEIGEIWVKGRCVAAGYYENDKATEETFKAFLSNNEGPFLRTGDLGFLDGDRLYVSGRLKDLIIINGSNHYPQDIEMTVYSSHEALRPNGGIAFSVTADESEKLVVVYEVKRNAFKYCNEEDIVNSIKRKVFQVHSIPVYDVVLIESSSLPKTSSGKLQRRLCKQQYLNNLLKVIEVQNSEM